MSYIKRGGGGSVFKAPQGFTLAEVLITLGIIGIVAALTMPALVAEFQEQAFRNQFKKAYSVMTQNLQKTAMVDFDGNTGCGYSQSWDNCPEFFEKFAENIKIIKTCDNKAFAGGCIPEYPLAASNGPCPGYNLSRVLNSNPAYVLADGMILMPYFDGSRYAPRFLVDVNGKKAPNKIGFDLFSLSINYSTANGGYSFGVGDFSNCLITSTDEMLFKNLNDIYK